MKKAKQTLIFIFMTFFTGTAFAQLVCTGDYSIY